MNDSKQPAAPVSLRSAQVHCARLQVASRVENLYFTYLFTLRAVQKAAPLLQALPYSSGYAAEDVQTAQLVSKLVRSCCLACVASHSLMCDEPAAFAYSHSQ